MTFSYKSCNVGEEKRSETISTKESGVARNFRDYSNLFMSSIILNGGGGGVDGIIARIILSPYSV